MNLTRSLLDLVARPLKLRRRLPPREPKSPRILVIRRNRMGDMIYTLPLLHALRRHHPHAHLTVACDPAGAPIARSCKSVDEVFVLDPGWNPWQAALKNAANLQEYDWVLAAKGGFDRRLAVLCRLTNATVRIGFERHPDQPSSYYTDPVELSPEPQEEHQIETLLRLLRPLGLVRPTSLTVDLSLSLPDSAVEFATGAMDHVGFPSGKFVMINLSSTAPLKFGEEDFIALATRVLGSSDMAVVLVGAITDQQKAHEIAACMASKRIASVDTPGPLELAALMEHAALVVTPEGGAAHLAAAVGRPALILWSEGPFKKWYSRGKKHAFVHPEPGEKTIPVERVWQALQPFLTPKKDDLEQKWSDMLEPPPAPRDFLS